MKTKIPYNQAYALALNFISRISPFCERAEIAGSVRRRKPEIGDIEIVAIPRYKQRDNPVGLLDNISLLEERIPLMFKVLKSGPKYKQLMVCNIPLDLFITTAPQWGVTYTLRTGSSDFSKWLVTPRVHSGACPSYLKIENGRIHDGKNFLQTPEEEDVFSALRLNYVPPEERVEANWFYSEMHRRIKL